MQHQPEWQEGYKLINLDQVMDLTGMTRSPIYSLMAAQKFPRPIKIGKHRVAWILQEVQQYLNERIAERNAKYNN